ncbi:CIR protein [Plasmodium chabaudi chabaudi]|uniref:CIR protein n=1 Tax=Plasmodium chabaudi chabaudi TaxID=31271 RepID=A0A4V0K250_PLACU|nr:CIR protein [Plasmodium chabaudi chabaudi]VTZ66334.1 CIR protein [Plasmodium chabaudi chabaudi]|eukprot:XP_016653049.1 CIR protein [Plasmodium chabaudi chabaudi]
MDTLCQLFKGFDENLVVKPNNSEFDSDNFPSFNNFCPFTDGGKKQKCNSYEEMVISAFLTLIINFASINDGGNIENDKIAQYAILWLCYKLNQRSENGTSDLNDFHNKYINGIETHILKLPNVNAYNSYKDIIKKQDMKVMDIKDISKLYEPLENLCKLYTGCDEKKGNYTNCSKDAHDFASNFENLNQDSRIIGNNSYREILLSLSTDYNKFKNGCGKKCIDCKDMPTLSEIKTPQSFEHASSSSSIASKLIPGLLIFAIPILLGVAYKYSLFGFDKRLKRIHSREKIKKIKKNVDHYM